MSDVKLIADGQDFNLSFKLGDFESDDGLETAILVSLFSDRRVRYDELIEGESDRKGWYGDVATDQTGDQIGSKLWLLDRGKASEETRKLSEEYASEALQWLLDDGVAETVDVTAVLVPRDRINLTIVITRPKERDKYFYRYQLIWENQYMNVRKA